MIPVLLSERRRAFHGRAAFVLSLLFLWSCSARPDAEAPRSVLEWSELPALPDPFGVAGAFAGVVSGPEDSSPGAFLVAGGANFPRGRPWDSATKVWHDRIFFLPDPAGEWRTLAERLPRRLAYGVPVTTPRGLVCIGGGDAERHSREVFVVVRRGDGVAFRALPELPRPVAFACGALLGNTIYVAGGRETPDAPRPLATSWALDLAAVDAGGAWRELPSWPGGRPRMLSVAAALDGAFFVIGGVDLLEGGASAGERTYLRDAYRFDPARGWRRIADLPRAAAAAPSPALVLGSSHLAVIGGDDGALAGEDPRDAHPGFNAEILVYHTVTDTWANVASFPKDTGPDPANDPHAGRWTPVTTPTCRWNDAWIIPSGEVRPGVRTPRVLRTTLADREARLAAPDVVVLIVYLASLVVMGVYFSRRERSLADFFLGGRRIPWWAAGLSIYGTQLSAITFMAIPALVFRTDWVYFLGNVTIVAVAPVVVFLYLPAYTRLESTTAYEILEERFHPVVRVVGGLSFLLFQLGRMGVVLYLPSLALATVTGMPVAACIVLMGVLATIYTVLGGIEAVVWTDVVQVIVLLGGATLSLVLCLGAIDEGLGALFESAARNGKLRFVVPGWDATAAVVWVVLLGRFLENLVPYTADQTVVQRYLATSDTRAAARAVWTNAALTIPGTLVFFALGTALWGFYREHPAALDPRLGTEDIFPWFIAEQLPVGVSGLVIAGLFAASMSSLDSSMNSMATVITTDLYRFRARASSEQSRLRVARVLTVVLGILGTASALLLAEIGGKSTWDAYTRIVGLFGSGLAGMFILGIFTRRTTWQGALIGFAASAVALYYLSFSPLHFFLFAGIGIATCVAVGWTTSWLFRVQGRASSGESS